MGKKKPGSGKSAAKQAKKAKVSAKIERKEIKVLKKTKGKSGDEEDEDQDLEGILERMRIDWEEKHQVTVETVEGPPSRRANATFTADPSGNHLWFIGGEFFSEDGKAHFYNDVYRYTPEKDEWRRYTSATCPGPRSAHAVVASPAAGGKLFLFGGEFSSLHQTTFHHYRDLWEFDISSSSWERIDTKLKPSARSGHRMAIWKHLIVLFGGFYDPGVRTQYLNDLWIFDTQEYTWAQIEMRDTDRKPSPRSGFSFVPSTDGILLHGGYCKEYVKGKRVQGIALDDTWFLKMSLDRKELKWERRKKAGYAPSIRSGCTMALWANRDTGVLFGGVKDDDQSEETLVSEFYNDLYGYNMAGGGRWTSLMLKKKKQASGRRQKPSKPQMRLQQQHQLRSDQDETSGSEEDKITPSRLDGLATESIEPPNLSFSKFDLEPADDDVHVVPLPRYNVMLAVLRNNLYLYGGILERGSREITMDDFWFLNLDKMDAYVCLKPLEVDVDAVGEGSSDEEGDEEDGDDDEYDEEGEDEDEDEEFTAGNEHQPDQVTDDATFERVVEVDTLELRIKANDFLNASKTMTVAETASTPLPGETLAAFYERTRDYWVQRAFITSTNQGKELRRDAFSLAEEGYDVYKPILREVEKILAEAGLDAEEMKKVSAGGGSGGASRNRR